MLVFKHNQSQIVEREVYLYKNNFMAISQALLVRCDSNCELCGTNKAEIEFVVTPKDGDDVSEMVALCNTCFSNLELELSDYWRCLESSIWSPYESVQALSYRVLYKFKDLNWVGDVLNNIDLDEDTINWALHSYQKPEVHMDAFGNVLTNGDTVVLTQNLNVKGTNFTSPKGTIVKKIKLVGDNVEQIEGKINDQVIVILTKFVKKG